MFKKLLFLLFFIVLFNSKLNSAERNFTISNEDIDFSAENTRGFVPFIVKFISYSDSNLTHEWDFGDSTRLSNEYSPQHVYTKAGSYAVTLKIFVNDTVYFKTIHNFIQIDERETLPVPPQWAFEPWIWEDNVNTEDKITNIAKRYRELDIPFGVVLLDSPWETNYNTLSFEPKRYPSAQTMINDFHDQDVRVILWITSLINTRSVDSPNYGKAQNYDYAFANNFFVNNGEVYDWWKGEGSFIDYTNPYALNWWHEQLDQVLDMGIDGWKTDAGNRLFPNVASCYNDSITYKEYSELYYKDFFEYTRQKTDNDFILFSKPVDEEQSDSIFVPQNYTPTAFVGDQLHDWSDLGLMNAIENVFHTAEKGYIAAGSDIGGYMGEMDYGKKLFIRWSQFGALCPIMVNGGQGEHRPWGFDEEALNVYRYYSKLHSQLVPYLYSYAVSGSDSNKSIVRPVDGDWQYTLGNELLVSIIYDYSNSKSKTVNLPKGSDWIDYWNDSKEYKGGEILDNIYYPYDQYPMFIKKGAIIPMSVADNTTGHGSEYSSGYLTFIHYPSDSSAFNYYDEAGGYRIESIKRNYGRQIILGPGNDKILFRIKYYGDLETIFLNNFPLSEYLKQSDFNNSDSGWYIDDSNHYLWIKFNMSGAGSVLKLKKIIADFTVDEQTGNAPLTVRFSNHSAGTIYRYSWEFGDGTESTDHSPVHTFVQNGIYSVSLSVENDKVSDTIIKHDYILVGDNTPQADFIASPLQGIVPLNVKFTNTSTGLYDTILWDFGDGTQSSLIDPGHIYNTAGEFSVSLFISGDFGNDTTYKENYISVSHSKPGAGFSCDPLEGTVPLSVQFSDSSIGEIDSWLWDFGDGENSTHQNPEHIYEISGSFDVSLIVSGPGGADTLNRINLITVFEQTPVAAFGASVVEGIVPLTVSFFDSSTGNISQWLWEFGDGNTSTVQNPEYTFEKVDSFTISLTVTGPGGIHSIVKNNYITVDFPTLIQSMNNFGIPDNYQLLINYPNPFNPVTNIPYALPVESKVTITIYNINGMLVDAFDLGLKNAGFHTFIWDAQSHSSGIYYVKLLAGNFTQTRKCLLLK